MSLTAVTVVWKNTAISGASGVYIIHYSDGITNKTKKVAVYPPIYVITELVNGHTYTFSLEATSRHLSAESENMTITLSESKTQLLL